MTHDPVAEPTSPSFEEALAGLEQIVEELEEGRLGLDAALRQYEVGVALLKSCYRRLEGAERRIELLTGFDAEGNPLTTPFDEQEAGSLDQARSQRSRKRTSSPRPAKDSGDAPADEGFMEQPLF